MENLELQLKQQIIEALNLEEITAEEIARAGTGSNSDFRPGVRTIRPTIERDRPSNSSGGATNASRTCCSMWTLSR